MSESAAACPDCEGTGSVTVEFRHGLQEQDCPTCGGFYRLNATLTHVEVWE